HIRPHDTYFVAGALFHIALAVPIAYWLVGCKVVLANFEPARSLDLISREGVTHILCTGTIFKMLVDEMEARPKANKISLMFCGGAPVSPNLVRRAMKLFNAGVAQIYGQTEVTLMATYLYPEDYAKGLIAVDGTPEAKRMQSVGRAAPLCVARVVDNDMRTLRHGEVGEIALMSDAVMQGYANMPEQTAETIRNGWLRTGDLGFMDEDGYIHLVDRKKDMIITGGENVYSAEVELVLAQHPAIADAVVIGVPDSHWGELVTAIVVSAAGKPKDAEDIRNFCRQALAGYKVPKRVEFVEALPRLPTGKIAKGALRDQFWAGHDRRIHGN
ncbi:MAG: class I adenylate-forming enzyme family protein, partial [Alphaproteobacteria bacterium]